MAQTEDTELRDLVIEALEKNGSLAKIRALLRANVFLVFEDEGQNLKQNVSLDNILKLPEGAVCLSIIHEFLEFCNLKNTLFVYMTESRQGTEYIYEGQKKLANKLNIPRKDNTKEPILITLLKQAMRTNQRKFLDQTDTHNLKNEDKPDENIFNDQNCTYIVHEDSNSSSTSNSQSDNSSDEKNKLHLRLQLDNSDTDTSSDSARDKSSSEYIPNEHITTNIESNKPAENKLLQNITPEVRHIKQSPIYGDRRNDASFLQGVKLVNSSSSESTSYIDLKPYNPLDTKVLNSTRVPVKEFNQKDVTNPATSKITSPISHNDDALRSVAKIDSLSEPLSSLTLKIEDTQSSKQKSTNDTDKSDADIAEYSNDFTSSPNHQIKDGTDDSLESPKVCNKEAAKGLTSFESPRQSSQSSPSSISISDVADLISERSTSFGKQNYDNNSTEAQTPNNRKVIKKKNRSKQSDDSAEFSESSVPSLSNLSLDIHSD